MVAADVAVPPRDGWVPPLGHLDGQLAPWATRAAGLKQVCLCCLAALICFPSACLLAWQALRRLQTTCCTVCASNVNEACPAALLVLLHVRDYACHGCGARSWTQCTHTNACGTSYGRYTRLGGLVSAVPLVRFSPPLYFEDTVHVSQHGSGGVSPSQHAPAVIHGAS